ncbi:MAG: arsenate reductase ArsC [Phycisphaerales bacterium]
MDTPVRKPFVLFLCTGNSARSQMAEALLRAKQGDRVEVASAGLEPKGVHPLTRPVLSEIGIDTSAHHSKPTTEFLGRVRVDYAVVVCDHAQRHCPRLQPFAAHNLFWPFEDPAAFEGDKEQKFEKFREVRDQISARIDEWLESGGPVILASDETLAASRHTGS